MSIIAKVVRSFNVDFNTFVFVMAINKWVGWSSLKVSQPARGAAIGFRRWLTFSSQPTRDMPIALVAILYLSSATIVAA